MPNKQEEYIYIMLSRTNTLLGNMIRAGLGVSYNHCSLSLDESLETIYSFGRKELRNVFLAGFVQESKNNGFFRVHNTSDIIVIRMSVSSQEKERLCEIIADFQASKDLYRYSLLGLVYCYFGIPVKRKNKYFCSQFVTEVLLEAGIQVFDKPATLVRPHDFLDLPSTKFIYTGQIKNYSFT